MKSSLIAIIIAGLSFTSIAQEVKLIACENCSYSQAKKWAQEHKPFPVCRPPINVVMTPDNQICTANEVRVVVADLAVGNNFAFRVGYENQYNPIQELLLYTNDEQLNANDLTAISDLKTTERNFSKFINDFNNENTVTTVSNDMTLSNRMNYASSTNSTTSCDTSIETAVSAAFDAKTSGRLQWRLNKKVEDEIRNPDQFFAAKEFNSTSFSLSVAGIGYSGTWKNVSKNFNVKVDLENSSSDVPESDYPQFEVVFSITWLKEYGSISVDLNPFKTYFEGIPWSDINDSELEISTCLEKALDKRFSSTTEPATSGGGSSSPRPPSGGIIPGGGGAIDDGWDKQLCKKHYYKDGKVIRTVRVRC